MQKRINCVILCAMICCLIFAGVILLDLFLTNVCFRKLSAKEIFSNNIYSVVEVKATAEDVGESFGTGEFVRNDGTLVTNAHVITHSVAGESVAFEKFYIRFADSVDYFLVTLQKFDTTLDVAILKYEGKEHKFKAVELDSEGKLSSGDSVFAIGNAMNYGLAITSGIVSIPLLDITYENVTRRVIQCDITIAEGNSGGALFDERGRLIGITTFRTKDKEGVVYGLAYCIPIATALDFLDKK